MILCDLFIILFAVVYHVETASIDKTTNRQEKVGLGKDYYNLKGAQTGLSRPSFPVAPTNWLLQQQQSKDGLRPMGLYRPWSMPEETEAERAERIHVALEKMLTFVNIAGQVEDYLAAQVKTAVKKVSSLVSSEEDDDEVVKSPKKRCH